MELRNDANISVPEPNFDPLAFAEALESEIQNAGGETPAMASPEPNFDPLAFVGRSDESSSALAIGLDSSASKAEGRGFSALRDGFSFFVRYVAVSSAVFAALLVMANFSAYSTVVWNWVSPESASANSAAVTEGMEKSKIVAYAAEEGSGATEAESVKEAEDLKKRLEESNVTVKENILSPKKLVPAKPQINVDFDIVPYENRIIVPKIGKNIPLVDVELTKNVDFDHMENIFMKELEKGVIRYPGTARPGENGNAFIFGHSSNFPWMPGAYNQVFALLDKLTYGDEIIVYYNQKKYVYVIREKKIVKPGDVKVLNRNPESKELSLMTCWPLGTTLKRMIVFAELQEPPAGTR